MYLSPSEVASDIVLFLVVVVVVLKPAWSRIEHHGTTTDLAGREQAEVEALMLLPLNSFFLIFARLELFKMTIGGLFICVYYYCFKLFNEQVILYT